jgi:pimeloyl-ACP methyl ester carboxylesterase
MTNTPSIGGVSIRAGSAVLDGDLVVPRDPAGLIIFVHGSGSSRFSPRNRTVASGLQAEGFATLLVDLLTAREAAIDERTREYRFDVSRFAARVTAAIDWAGGVPSLIGLPVILFGASTGAAAALMAAAERPDVVRAVISRGGRPDLAGAALGGVRAPTLLIVGGLDTAVIQLNRAALEQLYAPGHLAIVPWATHLFEEPGALEQVCRLAVDWCRECTRMADTS